MQIPWGENKCILCLEEKEMTKEHLIPESLWGKLFCEFLCEKCNSKLGGDIEKNIKHDIAIRLAVEAMAEKIPKLLTKFRDKQDYILKTKSGEKIPGKIRDGQFFVNGLNSGVELGQRTQSWPYSFNKERKKQAGKIIPDLSKNNDINELVLLKIAYEFLALRIGNLIYRDFPDLVDSRKMLQDFYFDSQFIKIEPLHANQYRPFHGVGFEKNTPYIVIQIRLFDWIAYRVHFTRTALKGPMFRYTNHLDLGKEDIAEI